MYLAGLLASTTILFSEMTFSPGALDWIRTAAAVGKVY